MEEFIINKDGKVYHTAKTPIYLLSKDLQFSGFFCYIRGSETSILIRLTISIFVQWLFFELQM